MLSTAASLVALVGFVLMCAWLVDRRLVAVPLAGLGVAGVVVVADGPVVAGMLAGLAGLSLPVGVWMWRLSTEVARARRMAGRRLIVVAGHVSVDDDLWPVVDHRGRVPADESVVQVVRSVGGRLVVTPAPPQPGPDRLPDGPRER